MGELTGPALHAPDDCETRALWPRRLAEAAAESGALPAGDAFAQHLVRVEEMTRTTKLFVEAGRRHLLEVQVADFHLAEAKGLAARSAKK